MKKTIVAILIGVGALAALAGAVHERLTRDPDVLCDDGTETWSPRKGHPCYATDAPRFRLF